MLISTEKLPNILKIWCAIKKKLFLPFKPSKLGENVDIKKNTMNKKYVILYVGKCGWGKKSWKFFSYIFSFEKKPHSRKISSSDNI